MRDVWRLSGIAIVFIVLLRLAIGWQLVYEGLWKVDTLSSAKPWTSAGYLRNARGPLREAFRRMTGDPDDLQWLDYDWAAARLDAYKDAFLACHRDLDDNQKSKLSDLLDGPDRFAVRLAKLPSGVKLSGPIGKVVSYDADSGLLAVDGKKHLLPKEKLELEKLVAGSKDAEAEAFRKAVNQVFRQSSKLSFKERLAVLLKIDPERAGQVYRDENKQVVESRKGKIDHYKELLARYEQALPRVRQDFERRHLAAQEEEIQKLRAELVNPVKALESEFKQEARKLLNVEQLARAAVPEPWTPQRRIDDLTIWSLLVLGCLLMIGLFSRIAAVAAAGLILSFYLAVPPWPGVAELIETAGPEHSLFVNKNLIEVIALLGIAAMPTGQWFGIDRLVSGFCRRQRQTSSTSPGAQAHG